MHPVIVFFSKGGWLSIVWGPKRMFAGSLLSSSIVTIAISAIYLLDNHQFYVALVLRIVTGFTHGPLFPATYAVWSMWAVPLERSTLTSIGFCSTNLGTCQCTFMLTLISHSRLLTSCDDATGRSALSLRHLGLGLHLHDDGPTRFRLASIVALACG